MNNDDNINISDQGVLAAQRFGCWTFDQAVVDSIPGLGVIKAPRPTRPSIPPG